MIEDFNDDTHFCLKCHMTILGLDNYVTHRKTDCSKVEINSSKSPLSTNFFPTDESLSKAVHFFSSLELQSSSKIQASQITLKRNDTVLTRSKISNLHLNSSPRNDFQQSKTGKNIWEHDNIESMDRRKDEDSKSDDSDESSDYDYEGDETSDEDAPPKNHTGGKWKPSSPIQWSGNVQESRDWNVPPPNFTGGKWKPMQTKRVTSPPPTHTKGKWKPAEFQKEYQTPASSFIETKLNQPKVEPDLTLPPTRGKVKAKETADFDESPLTLDGFLNHDTESSKKDRISSKTSLLPTYTKGKWKPRDVKKGTLTKLAEDSPFVKSGGSIHYWCRPCNRRLASKIVYQRHLKSALHYKRLFQDKEFDDDEFQLARQQKKVTKTKVRNSLDLSLIRLRQKMYFHCTVCRCRVNKRMVGKHLISHFHCRNSNLSTYKARKIILDNIENIVYQSPFQCNTCKFYCNTQNDFLRHWLSESHNETQAEQEGYFLCSFCNIKAESSSVMYDHLVSEEHKEVLSVINRSVPVVIKKIIPIVCNICNEEFLLNIQYLKHCQIKNHSVDESRYRHGTISCEKCAKVFRSKISLNRHKQQSHQQKTFFCSLCDLTFFDSKMARKHRNSYEHRWVALKKKKKLRQRKCDYCDSLFENFLALKNHLKTQHLEHQPRCPHCNMSFTVVQELTVHLRTKSCSIEENSQAKYSCEKCLYSTDSQAELLYHEALHQEPLFFRADEDSSEPPYKKKKDANYKCSICEKFYPKYSLLGHFRVHIKERPYVCSVCGNGFVRKTNWRYHMKSHDKKMRTVKKQKAALDGGNAPPFLCSVCGNSFQKKCILNQHILTHTGKPFKCMEKGCFYTGRSLGELNQHHLLHFNNRSFNCNICDYKAKTKAMLKKHFTTHDAVKKYKCSFCDFVTKSSSHLKRHSRIHTGSKPFQCPYCTYKCNNLENLRKHILSTNKHPGKCIYECKFCTHNHFKTNLAKEFKVHLIQKHGDAFPDESRASASIAGIYRSRDDSHAESNSIDNGFDIEDNESESVKKEPRRIGKLKTRIDPVVAGSSNDQLPSTNKDALMLIDARKSNEIFPNYIKDGVIFVEATPDPDSWTSVENYDVEGSGTLVETVNLFTEHFN